MDLYRYRYLKGSGTRSKDKWCKIYKIQTVESSNEPKWIRSKRSVLTFARKLIFKYLHIRVRQKQYFHCGFTIFASGYIFISNNKHNHILIMWARLVIFTSPILTVQYRVGQLFMIISIILKHVIMTLFIN